MPEFFDNPGQKIDFERLYRENFRAIAKLVRDFDLPGVEPGDVFQDAVLILVRKSAASGFVLMAQPGTLLYGIARNLLLQRMQKKREAPFDPQQNAFDRADAEPTDAVEEREARLMAVGRHLQSLEEACRQLLLLVYSEKAPYRDIAARMGLTEQFVKVKKFRCLDYLRKKVKNDPFFSN